ncbi:Wzz/FepE/Etk N-terminal domain-containing protein [Gammaproteobacteria bacterium]|nr:Wzz/FepE/Etk N-terminal domain-containing protein [Gammaproteobacteria bacterium]
MTDSDSIQNSNEENELNLAEIYQVLLENIKMIFAVTLICFVVAALYSLSIPNIYTSHSQLTAVESSGKSSQSSKLGGLASLAGISLGSSGAEDRGTFAVETIKSRDFFRHLLTFENTGPLIFAPSYDRKTNTTTVDPKAYDTILKKWLIDEPSFLNTYYQYREMLDIYQDKAGFVYISITHQSPLFAADFLSLIISEVNNLTRQRDLLESASSLEYLYTQLEDTKVSDIRLAINQLIESQLKKTMLANVREHYLLQPLDTAYIPEIKTSPQRRNMSLLSALAGFLLSIMFFLTVHYGFIKNSKIRS